MRLDHSSSLTFPSREAGVGAEASFCFSIRELSSRKTRLRCSCSACAAGVQQWRLWAHPSSWQPW
jgi:ribosomal protein L44E